MIINYDLKDKKCITPCPMKKYSNSQKAMVGDGWCYSCAYNMGETDQKVDCSFMDCDEGRKKMIGEMLAEDDELKNDQNQAYQAALIRPTFETLEKIQCSTCYNHVKKEGDLCDFCLEKIRYGNDDVLPPVFEELEKKVIAWGKRTGLNDGSTIEKQLLKGAEEFGELCGAVLKEDYNKIIDGFGDTLVTLILAHNHFRKNSGLPIASCLEMAYDEIKDRTGKLVNGNFVKSEDNIWG